MESSCQVGGTGENPSRQDQPFSSSNQSLFFHPPTANHYFSPPPTNHYFLRGKKRSAVEGSSQAPKRLATSNDNQIDLNSLGPIDVKVRLGYFTTLGTDVILASQVGDFLILKADNEPTKNGEVKPPLWRVDGKTLIQKYECMDKVF